MSGSSSRTTAIDSRHLKKAREHVIYEELPEDKKVVYNNKNATIDDIIELLKEQMIHNENARNFVDKELDEVTFEHVDANKMDGTIRRCFVDTYMELYQQLHNDKTEEKIREYVEEGFEYEKKDSDHKFLILYGKHHGESEPLGILVYKCLDKIGYPDKIYISQLVVHKDFQRHSLGQRLMAEISCTYKNYSLYWLIRKINKQAIDFYNSFDGLSEWPKTEHQQTKGSSPPWPREYLQPEEDYYIGYSLKPEYQII